jgi:alkylated DNA repair dioxygenase AlkB
MNVSLRVAVLSADAALLAELRRVCEERAHSLVELHDLRWVPAADVLLLDADEAFERVDAVQAQHPATSIALVGDGSMRSVGRYRVLNRAWVGDRLGDELELAYIGIPARTGDDAALDKRVG